MFIPAKHRTFLGKNSPEFAVALLRQPNSQQANTRQLVQLSGAAAEIRHVVIGNDVRFAPDTLCWRLSKFGVNFPKDVQR
jgi:hypothetical protein